MSKKVSKPDKEWRKQLSLEQYRVTREHGTEPAFSGKYNGHTQDGKYVCVCCGAELSTYRNITLPAGLKLAAR
ncbi:MAG: peptide-methionine (R)-S-oxide reductase [Arenicellales bacterium WSBS_2016_MAG_OTU3]